MSVVGKPYSLHTLFNEKFKVTQQDLGRKPDSSLTQEAKENFLNREVEVRVSEIVIPKMQRDYAQGRSNEAEVRGNFLQALYDAIGDDSGRRRCSLNFIYGHFLESRERDGEVSFVPYDGQQRLTTLYLLYWYASRRDAVEHVAADYLRGFRYDTRFSSTTFTTMFLSDVTNLFLSEEEAKWLKRLNVQNAVEGEMVPVGNVGDCGVFSSWLKNKNGFARCWQDDPTVRGMLTMLDAIHAKFHDVPHLWLRLCESDPTKLPIYFFFQQVARNSEAGSTFIKMNSRGKLLTEFECFKADFLRLLRKGGYPDVKREKLTEKINKTWELSFWALAKRLRLEESDTDILLMRYVNFVIDLIGFERNGIDKRNRRLHLYDSSRFKKVVLSTEGGLNEDVIDELTAAVDTWCGVGLESRGDEYFQGVFCREDETREVNGDGGPNDNESGRRIRLFFNPDPSEIFSTIILGKELTLNAIAIFHAVLIARRIGLSKGLFDLRLRSIRNLVYFMDKGEAELPYILEKVRLIMESEVGLSGVDFANGVSTRKFTDAQIREERFKEWLATKNSIRYWEIRELEESDWFKGQVGALLHEVLCAADESMKLSLLESVFASRVALFKKLFCSGPIPDSIIRKALFSASEEGLDYWVSSKGWFWMGASSYDFAWTAGHPYFARGGKVQEALRALLDHPFFKTMSGDGNALLGAFGNRPRKFEDKDSFGIVDYLNRYYDDFFEKWTQDESEGCSSCVGRILPGHGGLTMQMLAGKTRSSQYWDPFLYAALKDVDPNSLNGSANGKFKNLFRQYDAWNVCSVTHWESNAEVWNDPFGIKIKARQEIINILQPQIGLEFQKECVNQPMETDDDHVWLLRTRATEDQTLRDQKDRIVVCKKLLKAIVDAFPNDAS